MSDFSYKILYEIQPEEWNKNLKKSNYSNFFQTAEYLYSQKEDLKKFPIFLYILNESGEIKGLLGMVVQKIPFIRLGILSLSVLAICQSGVVTDYGPAIGLCINISGQLKELKVAT